MFLVSDPSLPHQRRPAYHDKLSAQWLLSAKEPFRARLVAITFLFAHTNTLSIWTVWRICLIQAGAGHFGPLYKCTGSQSKPVLLATRLDPLNAISRPYPIHLNP